jgi:hypothetical protein
MWIRDGGRFLAVEWFGPLGFHFFGKPVIDWFPEWRASNPAKTYQCQVGPGCENATPDGPCCGIEARVSKRHSSVIRDALEQSHARMCGDGHAYRECAKCRDGLAALSSLIEQLEAMRDRIEEAVSIMPDPMHPQFPPDKVDAQARVIRLLTLEDPYPAKAPMISDEGMIQPHYRPGDLDANPASREEGE